MITCITATCVLLLTKQLSCQTNTSRFLPLKYLFLVRTFMSGPAVSCADKRLPLIRATPTARSRLSTPLLAAAKLLLLQAFAMIEARASSGRSLLRGFQFNGESGDKVPQKGILRLIQHTIFHVCITSDKLAAFAFESNSRSTLRANGFECLMVPVLCLLVHKQCNLACTN